MPDQLQAICDAITRLLSEVPPTVTILAACKNRTIQEVETAFQAGIRYFGHNYVQEAQAMLPVLNFKAEWHLIGHLQRNKSAAAVQLFQMVETVDSIRLARELEKQCNIQDKTLPILIEINSGYEEDKTGIFPEGVDKLVNEIINLPHLRLEGLMTMGPRFGDPEAARSFFSRTRQIFERLSASNLPNQPLRWLSMGMSNSYRVAIEEGANLIRLGTVIFGSR